MTEPEIAAQCFELFRQACAAFERGDMAEHERLRMAHKELADQHRAIAMLGEQTIQ